MDEPLQILYLPVFFNIVPSGRGYSVLLKLFYDSLVYLIILPTNAINVLDLSDKSYTPKPNSIVSKSTSMDTHFFLSNDLHILQITLRTIKFN